jgi:hypothetical protein
VIPIVIRRRKGRWTVQTRELERMFADETAAMKSAVQFAHESGRNGSPAVVVRQEGKTKLTDVWTYGSDTYPPTVSSRRRAARGARARR